MCYHGNFAEEVAAMAEKYLPREKVEKPKTKIKDAPPIRPMMKDLLGYGERELATVSPRAG